MIYGSCRTSTYAPHGNQRVKKVKCSYVDKIVYDSIILYTYHRVNPTAKFLLRSTRDNFPMPGGNSRPDHGTHATVVVHR